MQVQRSISSKAPDGKVVFIPNVVPGDVIDVQTFKSASLIMKEKQFIFMNIQNTVPNLYEHFGVCGGCKWQNMKYSQQLYYKQNEVLNHLQRIGKVELPDFEPILGSEKQFFYRKKWNFLFQTAAG
jgi:23S rRNA (uracil1939-C5)-methyltransferase